MRNALLALIAVLSMACSSTIAFSQQCSLADFDKASPPGVRDITPPTNDSKFEWGSDVDPWNGQARGWHYIKNWHDKRLSLTWPKPQVLIPFDKPLEANGVFCKYDYGTMESYKLDKDAPISVSNDGMKAAQAYVQIAGKRETADKSITTGAELRRTYQTATGEVANAFARILLRYFPSDKSLEVDVSSGPGEIRVGFGPDIAGVSQDKFFEKLKTSELDFQGPVTLGDFDKRDDLRPLGVNPAVKIALVRAERERTLKFEDLSAAPSGVAAMILIAPDGAPLALTTVRLDILGGAR
jgi:hypothetical protein